MASLKNKRLHVEYDSVPDHQPSVMVKLPERCRKSVRTHINTIYVGTIIRIYDPRFGTEGQLATAHWCTSDGIYVTLHNEQKCDFVDLKYKKWVVDHRCVKVGEMILPSTRKIQTAISFPMSSDGPSTLPITWLGKGNFATSSL